LKNCIHIIGAGVSGLAAATELADKGYNVCVFDKNKRAGGRLNYWQKGGFRFDMGPSWYWMPEVFENFFKSNGSSISEHYELKRLDPAYRVFFGEDDVVDIPADWDSIKSTFESLEGGAAEKLEQFMNEASYKYEVGMNEFVWKPGKSLAEFAQMKVLRSLFKLDMLTSMSRHVRRYFKDPRLIQIMEFPVLFLGAAPGKTPALYSLMNYADLKLGTWYPMGGMHEIAKAMETLARKKGVQFFYDQEIADIHASKNKVNGIRTKTGQFYNADAVIASADYHHVDQKLLPTEFRQYSSSYWEKRKMAPSSLLFYIGLDRTIDGLTHHNLFFDEDFKLHAKSIYKQKTWPKDPLFYICCPSKTDDSVAPAGKENLFVLVPLAAGLEDSTEKREELYNYIVAKLKMYTGINIDKHIQVKRSFAMEDFKSVYNSFKGNAYGLANTLSQTAILKPSMHHKKLKNLLFAGQLTVPGPGLPPSIISGQLAAREMNKIFQSSKFKAV
jgi:phytoene desaturase